MFLCSSGYFLTNNKNLPRQPQISQIMLDSPHHPRNEVTKKPRKSLILNELRGGAGAWPVTRWYTTSYEDLFLPTIQSGFPVGILSLGSLLQTLGIEVSPDPEGHHPVFKHFWDHPPTVRPWASHALLTSESCLISEVWYLVLCCCSHEGIVAEELVFSNNYFRKGTKKSPLSGAKVRIT